MRELWRHLFGAVLPVELMPVELPVAGVVGAASKRCGVVPAAPCCPVLLSIPQWLCHQQPHPTNWPPTPSTHPAALQAIVAEQFFFIALYYATGDVATFVLFRWLSNLLTVVAVRLPPPGARCEEVPDEAGELAAAAAAAAAAGGQPERTEGKKEQ